MIMIKLMLMFAFANLIDFELSSVIEFTSDSVRDFEENKVVLSMIMLGG